MSKWVKVVLGVLGVIIGGVVMYFVMSWLLDIMLWGLVGLFVVGSALGIIKG